MLRPGIDSLKNWGPLRLLRRRRYEALFAVANDMQLFCGVHRSFEEARVAAPKTKPTGYDQPGPAAMYRDRTKRPEPRDYPVMLWLRSETEAGARRVFDLGGHVGVKFFAYRNHLAYPPDLQWTVCDVEAVVAAGRAHLPPGETRLGFTTRYADMDGADVLLALGSLQYIEQRLPELLAPLAELPKALILNGLPLHDGADAVTLQSIGVAFCPYHVFNRARLIGEIEALGYRLEDEWGCPGKACIIPFHSDHSVDEYTGLYFKKVS